MKKSEIFLMFFCVLAVSCKKAEAPYFQTFSLRVVNTVYNRPVLKVNSGLRDSVVGYNGNLFTIFSGNRDVRVYPVKDSAHAYFFVSKRFEAGSTYSLYLAGAAPQVDTMFVQDYLPPYYQDSTLGVRCVNLSTGKSVYHITLAADTTTAVFSNLGYKTVSAFQQFPLKTVVPAGSVSFQVRDVDEHLLTSYTLPASANSTYASISITDSRNRNITLVISGSLDSASTSVNKFQLFPVKNY